MCRNLNENENLELITETLSTHKLIPTFSISVITPFASSDSPTHKSPRYQPSPASVFSAARSRLPDTLKRLTFDIVRTISSAPSGRLLTSDFRDQCSPGATTDLERGVSRYITLLLKNS